ncbi:hypothetical protein PUN28_002154 [Cardiocondyla obscurior]|uniref:Uncharacterized protein n=1 Tax=Cardiocondyla obscurior TaxID=286306 RepID=A0AAW2GSY4_9HYME
MHTGLFQAFLFSPARVRQLKKMHTSLFRAFYFHQQPRYGQNKKKYFEILQHCIHCAAFKIDHCAAIKKMLYEPYSSLPIFTSSRDMAKTKKIDTYGPIQAFYFHQQPRYMAKKQKINIFGIWQQNIVRNMAKKQKKYFEILQHSIVRHSNRCIRAYSKPLYSSEAEICRIWLKTKTNILKLSSVALSTEIWPKNKKIFFKFCKIALCSIQNSCIRAYYKPFIFIRNRDMAKETKTNIFGIIQRSIVRHSK